MRFAAALLSVLIGAGTPVWAGPWLREEGQGFFSTGVLAADRDSTDGSAYLEYGLTDRMTIGAKVDMSVAATGTLSDLSGHMFARLPLGGDGANWLQAVELGFGARTGGLTETDPFLRLAYSIGRGFEWRRRSGWMSLDASAELAVNGNDNLFKLDATTGLVMSPAWKVMMQVFMSGTDSDTFVTLAPSAILSPEDSDVDYQIGFEAQDDRIALRLGVWYEF